MNDRQAGAPVAPDGEEIPATGSTAVKKQSEPGEPPSRTALNPLVMVSGEDAGYCAGDACEIPVRAGRGEVQ